MALRRRSMRLALCALLIGTASAWALAPHDKAIGVQAHQKPEDAIDAQTQTQGDKGGATPAPTLVTPAKPASKQGNAEQHGESREQEGTEFWPTLLGYKFKITDSLIALSTLALTIFTGLLWRSTEKLWSAGERQIKLIEANADKQTRDTQDSLRVTADAAVASGRSADAAVRSADFTQRTFVINNRPRIAIGNIHVGTDVPIVPHVGWFPIGTFDFYNVGGSTAHVTSGDSTAFWNNSGLPMRHPLGSKRNPMIDRIKKIKDHPIIAPRVMQPGEMDTGLFNSGNAAFGHREVDSFLDVSSNFNLYVAVWIEFCDDFGLIRRSYFCQIFDRTRGRFFPVNDPDYEREA